MKTYRSFSDLLPTARRFSRQEMGLVLLALALLVLGALLHLYLISRVGIVGREILLLEHDVQVLRFENEDLQARWAAMASSQVMSARAAARGYQNLPPDQRLYVPVDGYSPPEPFLPADRMSPPSNHDLPPAYTQSLLDWVFGIFSAGGR